ncbi:hypothetical protein FIBSPDRAFT_884624 [Athelia psychrophila]|uniref:Uncharacterized protein n=1 Tax=Athelia psychrophila TaxID=1759441 RepID=A0A166SY22_9AGAM|nr:hypothetical protein FIBSPDRAFT_884624 [Fibularhizoctonia sp. CBS 109695]
MPCTYISFQEQAEVAIFVDRTKRNMPFEDQLTLSPVVIEHNNIMGMHATLVEAENECRVKHSSSKKQVPVYREQHGKVPASFQLVPEYVQSKTSAATLLKEKALKTLNRNKVQAILAPTPFYTDAFIATAPIQTSPATREWDSATSNLTPALSADSGLSSFNSIDSTYSLYSQSDIESSESTSLPIPRSQTPQFCYDSYGNITFPGRIAIVDNDNAHSINHSHILGSSTHRGRGHWITPQENQQYIDQTLGFGHIISWQGGQDNRYNQVITIPGPGKITTRKRQDYTDRMIGKNQSDTWPADTCFRSQVYLVGQGPEGGGLKKNA